MVQNRFKLSVFLAIDFSMLFYTITRCLVSFVETHPELRRIAMAGCCALFDIKHYPTIANWQARLYPGRQREKSIHTCRDAFPTL